MKYLKWLFDLIAIIVNSKEDISIQMSQEACLYVTKYPASVEELISSFHTFRYNLPPTV